MQKTNGQDNFSKHYILLFFMSESVFYRRMFVLHFENKKKKLKTELQSNFGYSKQTWMLPFSEVSFQTVLVVVVKGGQGACYKEPIRYCLTIVSSVILSSAKEPCSVALHNINTYHVLVWLGTSLKPDTGLAFINKLDLEVIELIQRKITSSAPSETARQEVIAILIDPVPINII